MVTETASHGAARLWPRTGRWALIVARKRVSVYSLALFADGRTA